MAVAAAWIISWLIGIGISVAIIVKSPRVPGISDKTEGLRKAAIVLGFVPCLGMALIAQLIYLGMYRAKLGRFLERQASAQDALSYEDFESGPPQRRGVTERPVAPNAAYDNSGGRRPARHGRPDRLAAPNPFDEAPHNPFEQAPPRNAVREAHPRNPFDETPPPNPFEQAPPRNAVREAHPRNPFDETPPPNPFDEAPPRNPFEY